MPNGGSDNCMNCALNRANQRSNAIKGFDPDNRIAFCTLRNLVIQSGRAWTYCNYSQSHYWTDTEVKGTYISEEEIHKFDPSKPVFTTGVKSEGYQRIPYYKGNAPHTDGGSKTCALCNKSFDRGVWLTSYATNGGFDHGFCSNEHYDYWVNNIGEKQLLSQEHTNLLEAIENGNITDIKNTLEKVTSSHKDSNHRKHPLSFTNDQGWSPIHLALIKLADNDDLSNLLEFMSADFPLLYNHHGWSPIHLAAYLGKGIALKTLLEVNYSDSERNNLNKKDLFGRHPVDIAASEGHLDAVSQLLNNTYKTQEEKDKGLLTACKTGNLFLAEALVKNGANVNTTGHRNWTPLMNAAYFASDPTLVTFLLDQGAEKYFKNKSGKDVLDELRPWASNSNVMLIKLIENHKKH